MAKKKVKAVKPKALKFKASKPLSFSRLNSAAKTKLRKWK